MLVFSLGVGIAALLAIAIGWRVTAPHKPFNVEEPIALQAPNVARGREIFDAGSCASCHATPGQPDRYRLGGGLALASPFGVFRPPNISPDPVDGIGKWNVADLANALVAGVSPKGEHYYPAFPYTSYTGMTLEDIGDLYAYLMTLPRVSGRAPPHRPTILFSVRRSVGVWKRLFFDERQSHALTNGDRVHDRGAYLVETLAHCAECHSTRNALGAIKSNTRFSGGIDPQGTGFVPNITSSRLQNWTEAEIVPMLKTGATPDHGRVGSSMADVVRNTSMLSEFDRQAIARYIKSLPGRATPAP